MTHLDWVLMQELKALGHDGGPKSIGYRSRTQNA